jgi:DNA segregation ATPase FtsK/SpoIIIE, S-DNA-T family
VWAWLWRESFFAIAWPQMCAWWARWFVYGWRWNRLARRHHFYVRDTADPHKPTLEVAELVRVEVRGRLHRLLVTLPAGLAPGTVEHAADAFANATGSLSCRVRRDRPGRVWIELLRKDPLRKLIPALPIPDAVDLEAVPIGRREDGSPWFLRILGTHVLVVGATGAGKASVLQAIMRSLARLIAAGLVEPWGFDPKGGMELAFGKKMYARTLFGTPEEMADALEECAGFVQARAAELAGTTRCHTPTAAMPLRLLIIDELASITALCERKTAIRVEKALGLILTQGRAVGVSVVAFLQDPGKDVVAYRNLFPTRVALRVGEAVEVDMVLGDGARDRGALADLIDPALPGVGFIRDGGNPEPIRVRAAYCTDDDIKATAEEFAFGAHRGLAVPPPRKPGGVDLTKPAEGSI